MEENSSRWRRLREQEEAARQEVAESARRFINRIHRQEREEQQQEEEAAARRGEEQRHALERDHGVAFPRATPPRVIRVGTSTPVSAISVTWA